MTDIAELERRINALEAAQHDTTETLRWVVAKLGRISAVQEEHGLRLERIETRIDGVESGNRRIEKKIDDLVTALPAIVAETMREVVHESRTA